jgi:hypothetical protein
MSKKANGHGQDQANGQGTAMPDVLNVVGEELHHLSTAVERLHDIVELPGVKDALRNAHCYAVLQGIDHVTQSLAGLSQFMSTLATLTPGEWTLDVEPARQTITLATLSERFRNPITPRAAAFDGDECEFF